jgi:hypothetical protein
MSPLRSLLALLVLPATFAACGPGDSSKSPDAATGDAGAGSIACYIAGQFRCKEYPEATNDELNNLPIECSSTSGVLTSPANCPMAGFQGKCTMGTGVGREVKRVYTGADLAYEQDFCVNTAMGVWSTTF